METVAGAQAVEHIVESLAGVLSFEDFAAGFPGEFEDVVGDEVGIELLAGFEHGGRFRIRGDDGIQGGVGAEQGVQNDLIRHLISETLVVGKDDDGTAAWLVDGLQLDVVGGVDDRFIDARTGAERTFSSGLLDGGSSIFGVRGEIGCEFGVAGEEHYGDLIFRFESLERLAGDSGDLRNALGHAAGDIEQEDQPDGLGLAAEVFDGLCSAVVEHDEVLLAKALDRPSVRDNLGVDTDEGDAGAEDWGFFLGRLGLLLSWLLSLLLRQRGGSEDDGGQ